MTQGSVVLVPRERLERWVVNFQGRHGTTGLQVVDGALAGAAADGSRFEARLPFAAAYDGLPDPAAFALAMTVPERWGVLLVRKGGFAVARVAGDTVQESKVGQRHVQGRTKAGGQSQQRFARRRDNQARQAYEAAADHAARILGADAVGTELVVVVGGDHGAVDEVLTDPRLRHVRVVPPWLPVPDPRRGILEQAVADAGSASVTVVNAEKS
jgi:predicted NBD/HSP70 family sugar kinase